MVTRTFTVKQFIDYTKRMPNLVEKMGNQINTDLAQSMQHNVRKFGVGRLKKTIARPRGTKQIQILYPTEEIQKIAQYVNKGQYPKHPIPAILFEASRAGIPTAGQKRPLGDLSSKEIRETGGFVQPKRSKAYKFLDRSFNETKQSIRKDFIKEMDKVLNS